MASVGLVPFRAKSAAWRSSDGELIAWTLSDSKARDQYRGGAFTLEFEHTTDGSWLNKLAGRATLGGLVSESEFQTLVAIQRDVIQSLERPPATHVAEIPVSLRERYLATFDPDAEVRRKDFWMRYTSEGHLSLWWPAIVRLLPSVVQRAWTLDPHKLYRDGALIW